MKDLSSNDFAKQSLAQAIEEMKSLQGEDFSINTINLAELQRRTGISRQRLRTLKANGFKYLPHARTGRSNQTSVLDGYTAIIDNLLKQGVWYVLLRKTSLRAGSSTITVTLMRLHWNGACSTMDNSADILVTHELKLVDLTEP